MNTKKGQISLGDAPSVILVVGLVFLIMATVAYIGYQYQDAFGAELSGSETNESVTQSAMSTGYILNGARQCNARTYTLTGIYNNTHLAISTANGSISSVGVFTNTTSHAVDYGTWKVSYTYKYSGSHCNVTSSMITNINNNTSIAGIVLTIALVGIVLAILIGVFVLVGRKGM